MTVKWFGDKALDNYLRGCQRRCNFPSSLEACILWCRARGPATSMRTMAAALRGFAHGRAATCVRFPSSRRQTSRLYNANDAGDRSNAIVGDGITVEGGRDFLVSGRWGLSVMPSSRRSAAERNAGCLCALEDGDITSRASGFGALSSRFLPDRTATTAAHHGHVPEQPA